MFFEEYIPFSKFLLLLHPRKGHEPLCSCSTRARGEAYHFFASMEHLEEETENMLVLWVKWWQKKKIMCALQ